MNRFKQSVSRMWRVAMLVHSLSHVVIPLTVLTALLSNIAPYFNIVMSSIIIDKLTEGTDLRELGLWAAVTVGINVLLTLIKGAAEKYRMIRVYAFSRQWYMMFCKKIVGMDYQYTEDPAIHEMFEKIDNEQRTVGSWFQLINLIQTIITSAVGMAASIAIAGALFVNMGDGRGFINTPWFSLLFIGFIILSTLLTFPIDKRFFAKIYKAIDDMSKHSRLFSYLCDVIASYKNGKDVRIYDAAHMLDDAVHTSWGEHDGYFARFKRLCILDSSLKAVKGGLTAVTGGLIYLFVALKAVFGGLSVGRIVRYAGAVTRFIGDFSALINGINTFNLTAARMGTTFEFLAIPNVLYKGSLTVEKRTDNEYEIAFHDVSFKYPGTDAYVLRNLNMKLHIGQRLAVVGMNGSGKTTMIKLLCRLYDPTEGTITLNGIDIRKYDYDEYLGLFSVVFQDFQLFAFTLGENVATSLDVDAQRAHESLHKAGFANRAATMPKGLATPLYKHFDADGVEISGGEAQKIALARALYKDAPFIVLDEPTAALDPIAEFEIYSTFNGIVGDKTAIYISHRLSSCRFCDDIAVFHEGRLIQRGSHATLIADADGKYCELWNAQAQYYNDKTKSTA